MNKNERTKEGILIDILGETYTVKALKAKDNPTLFKEKEGYCDSFLKEIVVENFPDEEIPQRRTQKIDENNECALNEVLRHELTHAFLKECGLGNSSGFQDETFIEWIASQAPKLVKLFCRAKAFTDKEMNSFVTEYNTPNRILSDVVKKVKEERI